MNAATSLRLSHVVGLITGFYPPEENAPSEAEIAAHVDQMLNQPRLVELTEYRAVIIDQILQRVTVRIGQAQFLEESDGHEPWLEDVSPESFELWGRILEYLEVHGSLPPKVLTELDSSSSRALSLLESPARPGRWSRLGMVVGHVQSGKTTHYTALAAKALDAGYRIVVILAGMHNNLRAQTHLRIDHFLTGRNSRDQANHDDGVRAIGIKDPLLMPTPFEPSYEISTVTNAAENGDFRRSQAERVYPHVSDGTRLVMVVKKNYSVLGDLQKWLRSVQSAQQNAAGYRIDHPALFIDDEADQASLNTGKDGDEPTTINKMIRELMGLFNRSAYVGYTATPFANIFADVEVGDDQRELGRDLFPRSFIVNLKPPSNYIGPRHVFGHDGDESVGIEASEPLPMHVPVKDSEDWIPPKHKKEHRIGELPDSLSEAIRLFILNCAVRQLRGDGSSHNSMLVHATRYKGLQARVRDQIRLFMETVEELITSGSEGDHEIQMDALRKLYETELVTKHPRFLEASELRVVAEMPAWESVCELIPKVMAKIDLLMINGDSSDTLAYENKRDTGFWVIAVGGSKLSRGLTLEGLSVSYFLRSSKAFDTLMQMGRWFGYRPRYADLCRVYTPSDLALAFRQISLATEELREELDRMVVTGEDPTQFGLQVRRPSDGLLITAANKLRRGQSIQVRFAGTIVQATRFPSDGPAAAGNRDAVETLLEGREYDRLLRGREVGWYIHRNVPAEDVLRFLSGYTASQSTAFIRNCSGLRRYIEAQNAEDELTDWTVVLMSNVRSEARTEIAGRSVGLLTRQRRDGAGSDQFQVGSVVWTADETADLNVDEHRAAIESEPALVTQKGQGEPVPGRKPIRRARPAERGLLLLYPLQNKAVPGSAGVNMPDDSWVLSAAISFPSSMTAKDVTYVANEVKLGQGLLFDPEEPDDDE